MLFKKMATTNHTNFRKLWAGQSLNLLGDQLLSVVLPLLAISVAHATISQAALLRFALFLPFLFFGLPAGAIVDRLSLKKTMITCDLFQAVIFLIVAILAITSYLNFFILLLLLFFSGIAIVFFQVSYSSFLPEIFSEKEGLHAGNTRLFFSESVARTLGPMIAGPIIAWFGIVTAIIINVATFICSVTSLLTIKLKETAIESPKQRTSGWLLRDIKEGLHFIVNHKKLEPVIFCGVVYVLFLSMVESSLVLFCYEILKLNPSEIGFVIGAATLGFPIGNLVSSRCVSRFGVARTLVMGAVIAVLGLSTIPIAGLLFNSIIGLILASVLHGVGEGIFGPTALTLRQTESPKALLGRVNSVQRFLIWGATPIGSLAASLVIKYAGLQNVLWIGGLGTVLCLVPLLRRDILNDLRTAKRAELI